MRRIVFFLLLLPILLSSCSRNWISIERNEQLLNQDREIKKIICIDPRFYFEEDELNFDLEKNQKITQTVRKNILKSSKSNNFDLSIFDFKENTTTNFYNDLLTLKKQMVSVNFNQATPLNFNKQTTVGEIEKKIFVYPPKISFDFVKLSEEYGTPYFSYMGIYAQKRKLILYHLVIDTDNSETVYREFKVVNSRVSKITIAQMIYDSYAMLKSEFK